MFKGKFSFSKSFNCAREDILNFSTFQGIKRPARGIGIISHLSTFQTFFKDSEAILMIKSGIYSFPMSALSVKCWHTKYAFQSLFG